MSTKEDEKKLTKEEIKELIRNSLSFSRALSHRVCLDCYSSSISSVLKNGLEEIRCDNCKAIQPTEQTPLTDSDWKKLVEMGAPKFYLRNQEDVLDEIGDGHYTKIFRKHNAHPYEDEMPEELRGICHIYYDEVRHKFSLKQTYARYTNRGISRNHISCFINHFKSVEPFNRGILHGRDDLGTLEIVDIQKICETDEDSARLIFDILKSERDSYNRRKEFDALYE